MNRYADGEHRFNVFVNFPIIPWFQEVSTRQTETEITRHDATIQGPLEKNETHGRLSDSERRTVRNTIPKKWWKTGRKLLENWGKLARSFADRL
jgi:hypothetical protein